MEALQATSLMATTFLEYLALPNPDLDTSKFKEGPPYKSQVTYGPDDVKKLKGATWQDLNATFRDVLAERMNKPKVTNAQDVPAVKTELWEESGVLTLAQEWSEPVVNHALSGTQEKLRLKDPERPLGGGELHFLKNDGRGDLKDEKGKKHKPDWFFFQKQADGDHKLVFGDMKPAKKFSSQDINSKDPQKKQDSKYALEQITKYLWLGKTRYGFLLTDEELVLVRLSICKPHTEEPEPDPKEEHFSRMLKQSKGSALKSPGPYLVLEWSRIPWSSSGSNKLTVNLGLWWWCVLAIQSCSIKEWSKYTSFGESKRGHSPEYDIQELAIQQRRPHRDEQEWTPCERGRRESQVSPQPSRRSKRPRSTPSYVESESPPSTRQRSFANDATSTHNSFYSVAVTTPNAGTRTSARRPKTPSFNNASFHQSQRRRRRAASRASSQVTPMSSQTTEPLCTSFLSSNSQATEPLGASFQSSNSRA